MDRKFTIVVAEDDANHRNRLQLAVGQLNRQVELRELKDALQVIEYLNRESRFADTKQFPMPDLLMLDLKTPLVALRVIAWLRMKPGFGRLPVVMVGASELAEDVAEAYRLGVNSYIRKPSDFSEFVQKLGVVIDYWLMTEKLRTDSREVTS
jgi:two-component system response regulator